MRKLYSYPTYPEELNQLGAPRAVLFSHALPLIHRVVDTNPFTHGKHPNQNRSAQISFVIVGTGHPHVMEMLWHTGQREAILPR